MSKREFEYFGFDEDPIGKYKQPKPGPRCKGSGYPVDDIDREGTKTYGRYIKPKGGKKHRMEIRGTGAATKGKRFFDMDEDRDDPETTG